MGRRAVPPAGKGPAARQDAGGQGGNVGLRARLRLGGVAALAAVLVACNSLTVDQSGAYTSSPTETITGTVEVASDDTMESLTVNGVEATIDGTTWTSEVPLDGEAIFYQLRAEYRLGS